MALKRWDGAVYVDLTTMKRWDGASWIDLTVAKRWDGATWVDMGAPSGSLSATVNPASAEGQEIYSGEAFTEVFSNPVTVTSTGGSGAGPTFAWTRLSGSSAVSATSPSSATTTFNAIIGRFGAGTRTAVMRCTVTRGVESVFVDVPVLLEVIE